MYTYLYLLYLIAVNLLVSNCTPVTIMDKIPKEGELFEGDILLLNNNREKRMTMQDIAPSTTEGGMAEGTAESNNTDQFDPEQVSGGLWPNKTVYYKIDPKIDQMLQLVYIAAIESWEHYTCLKFKKANDNTTAYLNLTADYEESCSSYIGRTGTVQKVTISHRCSGVGHAIHELGHAIGLWHEHTRPDRNKYIKVVWDNIKKERAYNFLIYDHPKMPRDIEYDFGSIMHYEKNAFAKDRKKPTIEVIYKPLPSCLPKMGQRDSISYKDALKVNKMYNCTGLLNSNKTDPCSLPPPASIAPTPTTATPTPSPSTSSSIVKPTPTCTIPKALKSENVITFPFADAFNSRWGCSGESCTREVCTDHKSARIYTCETQFFTIYLASNKRNRYIKDGDTVALRSIKRANHWVDCSRGNCTLTKCPENADGKTITNFTRDICNQHKFTIHIANSRARKPVRIKMAYIIYLKAIDSEKYLNCNGRKCRLISENGDCDEMDNSGSSGSLCSRQYFTTEKSEAECNK